MLSELFCKRLKYRRLQLGISQKKLGVLAGIDEFVASARMNHYERGVHQPCFQMIGLIAKALNVTPDYFFTTHDEVKNMSNPENTASQKVELETGSAEYLYNEMRLLSEDFTGKIFDLIHSEKVHGYDTNIVIDALMRAIGFPFISVFSNVVENVTPDDKSKYAVANGFLNCFTDNLIEKFLELFDSEFDSKQSTQGGD